MRGADTNKKNRRKIGEKIQPPKKRNARIYIYIHVYVREKPYHDAYILGEFHICWKVRICHLNNTDGIFLFDFFPVYHMTSYGFFHV